MGKMEGKSIKVWKYPSIGTLAASKKSTQLFLPICIFKGVRVV
jgi:hypothetical protein